MAASNVVVVMDFDKTILDCDSDNWVVDKLGATELFNELLPTMPLNSLMDRMMKELHIQGTKIEDIVAGVQWHYFCRCDLKIVSDANVFFIDTILKHHGLKECFSEINTNPSFVDEEGRLRIFPYHDFTKHPHGCSHPCPPNMCKVHTLLCYAPLLHDTYTISLIAVKQTKIS
ncbi:inorganic pyrophosphatase 2-like [Gossypium australe]|uniref:Inorganic pyrophosphatase 2-like n=1 Tax=Gossypium australe TaxID=47621 RepID=A0A5B6WDB0_9ROSI|nr:inorganic pyrophosphatase 2-like [Gossypium australe]